MKIREGAYYRTRRGDIVGPIQKRDHPEWSWQCGNHSWLGNGGWHRYGEPRELDLISEVYVSDTPPVNREITDEQFWGDVGDQQRKAAAILGTPETKTLRDEFAMAALTGLMADPQFKFIDFNDHAEGLYRIADAMMEARKK